MWDKCCVDVINRFIGFFQAEDGIRDLVRSRGLGDVYKRQGENVTVQVANFNSNQPAIDGKSKSSDAKSWQDRTCLLYTSDAADERSSVDLGGRRLITKKKQIK